MPVRKQTSHADAEVELTKLKVNGDTAAYQCATIYAQWGNTLKALEWLETALRLRDPGLIRLKVEPLREAAVGGLAKSRPYVRSSTELLSRYLYRHAIHTVADRKSKSRGRSVTSHISSGENP
jgi:hypothetical protein